MNIGLVGWGCTTGNGGMNSDLATLASWISHWLVPEHPKLPNHLPYLERAKAVGTIVIESSLNDNFDIVDSFLNNVDGIIYIEHPCYKNDKYNIVLEAKKRNKLVIGIPMWEWWPERKDWALATDILWAVTKFTENYLNSLSNVLFAHGWVHNWKGKVIYSRWGVDLNSFPFKQRHKAERFIFINGNGGYKMRKASDIVAKAFSLPGAPPLTVYSQQKDQIALFTSHNVNVIHKNFPDRKDVYSDGDVFLFPSYWEGLCHGIYEGQAVGGLVITTDIAPMNECGTPYLIPVEKYMQEDLSGKKILKAVPSYHRLFDIAISIYNSNIKNASITNRKYIEKEFNLEVNLLLFYKKLQELA
ncbi:glycosyltransferase [Gallibacterium anatis]|uniref:Glycosyltransferase n=1 Tax=Gallibacterium anatis TaxID=750 RepID=A0A1A7PCC3_9PAST|nr:hypothetical protein [Gallibacterium anatis]OBW94810.1 hypothetical protein QV02_06685 [Gallibacterium anatis]OBW99450.1 hypothetical protein QV03_03135 [Gallibacterium anatis]